MKQDLITGPTNINFVNSSSTVTYTVPQPEEVKLDKMRVNDVIFHNCEEGLRDRLERIEKLLNITPRRRDLEARWPEFCVYGEEYEQQLEEMARAYTEKAKEYDVLEKLNQNNEQKSTK